ncbi:MAG: guanylate kinase [Bacteroidota bacterium]
MTSSDASKQKMIIVSAPSGAGKTTIVKHLLGTFPQLGFSVSATSRKIREGEKDGREYYYISPEEFRLMIEKEQLLEWQEVYPGSYYGTQVSEVKRITTGGQFPVFDVDVVGGLNIKKMYGANALAVFIRPPSFEILESRLRSRATDSEESLQKRLSKAKWELSFEKDFDCVVVNDKLEEAFLDSEKLVKDFLGIIL